MDVQISMRLQELLNLKVFWCEDCTSLTRISEKLPNLIYGYQYCPWIKSNEEYKENIRKLVILQKFVKSNLTYWRFKRWIETKHFAEWFYSPQELGGRNAKIQLKKEISLV